MTTPIDDLRPFDRFDLSNSVVLGAIEEAVRQGAMSPCAKSKRGVSVFDARTGALVSGYNAPPAPFTCSGSKACREACGKVAVHAEERALNAWRALGRDPRGVHVLHLKVENGAPVPSDRPSCVTCSRSMLELRVGWVWLWTATGWRCWSAEEFHADTLLNLGLPVYQQRTAG